MKFESYLLFFFCSELLAGPREVIDSIMRFTGQKPAISGLGLDLILCYLSEHSELSAAELGR